MGIYLDLAAENPGLKEWYDNQKVENLAYDENPFMAMVPKETNATGKYIPIPIIYETSQGVSAQFNLAQQNQAPMQLAEFLLTLRRDYSIVTIDQQAAKAAADDKGSFIKFGTKYIDVGLQSSALRCARWQYRTGTGSTGQISSISGTGVVTLTNPSDVANFSVQQTLQAASTDGGTPRAAFGYIIARNVIAGTISLSATQGGPAGAPAGWVANDFLLNAGDSNAVMSGLAAWLPSVAPAPTDNFYGVNRSPDSRLYGLAYNGATQPVEEALIDSSMLLAREKGKPRHFFTNYGSLSALMKAGNARREFVDWEKDAEISFRGVKVQGPNGVIECYADRNCQAATGWLLQLSTWTTYSLGQTPHVFTWGDELEVLRIGNADAYEARTGFYANLGCNAPGWNSQVALAN
jgi:hypothetical protein